MNDLELLNQQYKELINSPQYKNGLKYLKFKYCLKHFKFITILKRIINSKKIKRYVFTKDNNMNSELFVNNNNNVINKYDTNEKIVIYTVIIGNYDHLLDPIFKDDNVDYVLVSDIKPKELGSWKWVDANKYLPNTNLSNVKKARFLKTHPHLIFKDYKYSIFIDGNIRCVTDVREFIGKIGKKTKIALHLHPYRDCIYKEAISCKYANKGNYKIIKKQMDKYKNDGMINNFGLFETGFIIREHNDPNCIKIMESWWDEINNYSERDQLSLTYVLWKSGYTANDIGVIYESILKNPKIQIVSHNYNYF